MAESAQAGIVASGEGPDASFSVYVDTPDAGVKLFAQCGSLEEAHMLYDRGVFLAFGRVDRLANPGYIAELGTSELDRYRATGTAPRTAVRPAYRGITYNPATGRWNARVNHDGRTHTADDDFPTDFEAAAAWDRTMLYFCGERGRSKVNFPSLAPTAGEMLLPSVRTRLQQLQEAQSSGGTADVPALSGSKYKGVWTTSVGTFAVVVSPPGVEPIHGGVYASERRAAREHDKQLLALAANLAFDATAHLNFPGGVRRRAGSVDSVASNDSLLLGIESSAEL